MPSPLLTRLSGLIAGSTRGASAAAGSFAVAAQDIRQQSPEGQQERFGDDWAAQNWEQLSAAQQEKVLADNEADRKEIEEKKEPRKTRKHRNHGPKKPHTEAVVVLEEPAKEESRLEKMLKDIGDFFKEHGAVMLVSFIGGVGVTNLLNGRRDEPEAAQQPDPQVHAFEGRAQRLGDAHDLRAQPALAELGRALLDGGAEAAPASAPAMRPPVAPQPNRSQSAPPSLAR